MRRISFYLLFLMVPLLLNGCSKGTIKIGLMADLSGRASTMGTSSRNGADLAVDDINSKGGIKGKKIELIVKDDKGLPETAVRIDKELVNEKVLLGVGHMTSGTGVPGLEVFKKAGILMVSPLMSTISLSGKDDVFLRVIGSNDKQGELLAKTAASKNFKNGMAIIYEYNNRAYSQEVCEVFKQEYMKSGGKVVFEESFISSPNFDFNKLAQRVAGSKADGVLIVSGGLDLGILVQKIRKLEPDIEIFSGMWGMTFDALQKGGKAIEGAYFAGVYDRKDQSAEFVKFRNAYIEKYQDEPTYASLFTYETVKFIADALEASEYWDTETIKQKILNAKILHGLQGDFNINHFGDAERAYFLFQVDQSEFVRVNTDEK